MEIVTEIREQPPAIYLAAVNATGLPTTREVGWSDLASAEVGGVYEATGGGALFSEIERATVVWRNEYTVVVLREDYYHGRGNDAHHKQWLEAYSL